MKLIRRHGQKYNFVGDPVSGATFRWGAVAADDPSCAPWPELADIAISNYCTASCSFCYRDSRADGQFMSVADYWFVMAQLRSDTWGSVFQVALGGGEPLEHPELIDIVEMTRQFGVVPNITTNGIHVTPVIASHLSGKVGAIAVSVSDIKSYPVSSVRHFVEADIRTNIHFLLRKASLSQATAILNGEYDDMLKGVNAVIFLTHKAKGRASADNNLEWDDELRTFIAAIDARRTVVRIGFDACFVPMLLCRTQLDARLIDPCECGFFSIYVDEMLNVSPCSFSSGCDYRWNLRDLAFERIWNDALSEYRLITKNNCQRVCPAHAGCRGRCAFFPDLTLCFSPTQGGVLS